jgi:hypothetical protein
VDEPFAARWQRKWTACGFEDIGTEMVACGEAVLPDAAAPFLSFGRADRPTPIWEVFGIPDHWPPAERERLAAFRIIGVDGAGNPLCVEQPGGAIVMLDHEDQFRTRQFVNSGVSQLAECLLAFMGERDPVRFRTAVRELDPPAMAERSFWWHEAAGFGSGQA